MITKLISTSIIAAAFLVGCGGETTVQDTQGVEKTSATQPKVRRDLSDPYSQEYKDFMATYDFGNENLSSNHRILGRFGFFMHLNNNNYHDNTVIYMDTDNNNQTGYFNKWHPKAGADYLLQGGVLFKFTGAGGTNEWSWEYVKDGSRDFSRGAMITSFYFDDNVELNQVFQNDNFLSYAVVYDENWNFQHFYGYLDKSNNKIDELSPPNEELNNNRETTIRHKYASTDEYLYMAVRDARFLRGTPKYFNYEFQMGNRSYHTEGPYLYDDNGNKIGSNLPYEIRRNYAITVIPKNLLNGGEINPNNMSATIRDANWGMLSTNKPN